MISILSNQNTLWTGRLKKPVPISIARAKLFTLGHAHQLTGVLTGRWDDLFSCLIPCLFGDTGIEPAELDI